MSEPAPPRRRCYDCYRPKKFCYCSLVPTIHNRTHVLLVQHLRERSHAFNTARTVARSLQNATLVSGHISDLQADLQLSSRAVLLFPDADAEPLTSFDHADRPDQLVVLDGTWHHAKTLLRDIPALERLKRYKLAPSTPSRFSIRREPNAVSLSTLEAVVAALQILEPETSGLDQLLLAFEAMVRSQHRIVKTPAGRRRNVRRRSGIGNVPIAIQRLQQTPSPANIVVAYGEADLLRADNDACSQSPIVLTAMRLPSGEHFACTIRPIGPLPDQFLEHLELSRADFDAALSPHDARCAWSEFLRPDDTLVVYYPGTARLLQQLTEQQHACLILKSVTFGIQGRYRSLEDLVVGENLKCSPPICSGRAGRRLSATVALVQQLSRCVSDEMEGRVTDV